MAKTKHARKSRTSGRNPAAPAAAAAVRPPVSGVALGIGAVLLLVSFGGAWALALERLAGLQLPGCGPESACAKAAASVWGRVPLVDWPLSYVGVAYFAALLWVWLASRGVIAGGMRWLVRLGGLGSIILTIVMVAGGYVCEYCLAVHVGNLLYCVLLEAVAPRPRGSGGGRLARSGGVATAGLVFGVATIALAGTDLAGRSMAARTAERELAESTRRIVSDVARDAPYAALPVAAEGGGFAGRWRLGPEVSPIRIVAFFSYQCPQCRVLERQITALCRERDDISFSVKHFPMGTACNPHVVNDVQPNACWAARAAEAAGLLRGRDGFWEMHEWLFENEGSFDSAKLRTQLLRMGYEVPQFSRLMQSEQTLKLVQADIEEGISLGLHQTPMIFINGVELRGWNAPNAVGRAIMALAATNPPALSAAADAPPRAMEKLVEDWRREPLRVIELTAEDHSRGPVMASVSVVLYGDYRQEATAELYGVLRRILEQRGDVRLVYRQFPFNQQCNPTARRTVYEDACTAALAAEGAAQLGGEEEFWRMHEWLMADRQTFDDGRLRAAADALGMDFDALSEAAASDAARAAVERQARSGATVGVTAVPMAFVNGRRVPRWKHGDTLIIERIIEEAAKGEVVEAGETP